MVPMVLAVKLDHSGLFLHQPHCLFFKVQPWWLSNWTNPNAGGGMESRGCHEMEGGKRFPVCSLVRRTGGRTADGLPRPSPSVQELKGSPSVQILGRTGVDAVGRST